jgi:5,10-methylenetetrahydromethanopterin reductase
MVNAAAIAGLAQRAPGRVAVAIGAGFSGRMALGERAMRWSEVASYINVLRTLLKGEDAEWSGATIRMLHPGGFGAARPVDIPILIGADGPMGAAVAAELGDGIFSVAIPQPGASTFTPWRALLSFGTVFDEGEDLNSQRVRDVLGPAAVVVYHATYERGGEAVDLLPGGAEWRKSIEAVPIATRHLALHEGHLVGVSERDQPFVDGLLSLASEMSLTGTPREIPDRLDRLESAGVTEIAFQPGGDDLSRELRAFSCAAGLQGCEEA